MNRRSTLAFILTAVLLSSFAPPASALYQWVDEKGNLHITDNPPPAKQSPEEPATPRTPEVLPAPVPAERPVVPATVPQAPKPAPAQAQPSPPAAPASALRPAAATPQTSPSRTSPQAVPVPTPAAPAVPAPEMPAAKETPRGPIPSPFPPGSALPANILAAMVAGFTTVFLVIAVGMYVFFALCLYLIAKKLDVAEAWAAWIPIIQVWPFLSSAGKPCWWVIFLLIPFVNAIVGVYLWMCIAENLGRNKWLGLLMLLPIINFVLIGALAFTKEETGRRAAGT